MKRKVQIIVAINYKGKIPHSITDIDSNSLDEDVTLFPNPTQGFYGGLYFYKASDILANRVKQVKLTRY